MLADTRELIEDRDVNGGQNVLGADTAVEEDVRATDSATSQDDFLGDVDRHARAVLGLCVLNRVGGQVAGGA